MLRAFVDLFEREGGHALLCLIVIGMGAGFYKLGIPKGEDLIVGGMSILARGMMGEQRRVSETNVSVQQTKTDVTNP